ncbi:MAG: response regulator [Tannerella sp.]|nr:response regulator [Tannerella sp.]
MKRIIIFILFFFPAILYSQSFIRLKHYSGSDGMSHSHIQNFVQDNRGYIWMSTWNGLERFDGYSFRNFRTYPTDSVRVTNHRFTEIKVSALNNIWCKTHDERLYLFDTRTEKFEDVFLYGMNDPVSGPVSVFVLENGITWAINSKAFYRIHESDYHSHDAIEVYTDQEYHTLGDVTYHVFLDKEGDEWILTDEGMLVVGKKQISGQIPFMFITENDNGIFLGTRQGLFVRYDSEKEELQPCAPSDTTSGIIGIYKLKEDKIAIIHDRKVSVYDSGKNSFNEYFLPDAPTATLLQDSKGIIWFFTVANRLVRLNDGEKKIDILDYPLKMPKSSYSRSEFIHEDGFGTIWAKSRNGAFCFYNQKTEKMEQAYIYDNGLKVEVGLEAYSYLIDSHDNLWYTNGEGFDYLTFYRKNFDYISSGYKLMARSIKEDRSKRIWVGWKRNNKSGEGHVSLHDSLGHWLGNLAEDGRIIQENNKLFHVDAYCIYEDKAGNIWIGTRDAGLFLLRLQVDGNYKATRYMHDDSDDYSILSNSVYDILQDSKARIWIAAYDGGLNLVEQNGDKVRFIHAGNRLKNYPIQTCERVRCLYETQKGIIWVGTTKGLLSFSSDFEKPDSIRFFYNTCDERNSSLSNNDVFNIIQTQKGNLLVTTLSGGVNMLDGEEQLSENLSFIHYNRIYGEVPDFSLSVIEDHIGNLWVASENRISRFDAKMNLMEIFQDQTLVSEAKPLLCSSGELMFGSTSGVLRISPYTIHENAFVPPVVFSDINVYVDNRSYQRRIDSVLILSAKERNFVVNFATLDYVNPQMIEYTYRMKGMGDQWINLGNNHSVSLINVPAGDYVFQVKSTNADGIWVDNMVSLPIRIEPTFRETIWARILYVLAIILVLVLVICIVIRITNLQRKVDFEKYLTNLKLRFFTDISHELRTPLTLIASPIDEIIGNEKLSDEGKENIQVAKRNVERMLRLINQILDFRKIQNQKMKVYVEQVDVLPLIKKIYGSFLPMANARRIDYQFNAQIQSLVMYTDVDKFEKILFNLLSNAFKYTSDGKKVALSVHVENTTLYISVEDEGKGISPQKMNKLFTRFETLNNINPNISSGIGLSLVRELLFLLHGDIKVQSTLGEGSTFVVMLPVDYHIFEKDKNAEFILNDGNKMITDEEIGFNTQEGKDAKILIVEDNNELRRFIYNVLSKEYIVLEAPDGKAGLEVTHSEIPDLVISDIMMPEMDGIEYLKTVKGNKDICHIPVILLSAKSALSDRIDGLEYGADDYITKPFSANYLKARIASLLKRRQELYNYYLSNVAITPDLQTSQTVAENRAGSADNNRMAHVQPSTPQITRFDDEFIKNVVQSIEDNFEKTDFKIEDLAEAMNMSRAVFYRKIKSLMGVSPVEFVKDMRIKRAVQLMDTGKYSISEIAYMTGFTTPQYFSKVFKSVMGCTPKDYRVKDN